MTYSAQGTPTVFSYSSSMLEDAASRHWQWLLRACGEDEWVSLLIKRWPICSSLGAFQCHTSRCCRQQRFSGSLRVLSCLANQGHGGGGTKFRPNCVSPPNAGLAEQLAEDSLFSRFTERMFPIFDLILWNITERDCYFTEKYDTLPFKSELTKLQIQLK